MEPSQQRRNYVTVVGMKVVVRTIEIRGHHAAIVAAILAIVAFAQHGPGDLGDGIRLIRGLGRAGAQRFLTHWPWRPSRIESVPPPQHVPPNPSPGARERVESG